MGACLQAKGRLKPAGGIPEAFLRAHKQGLWNPAGKHCLPFAGGARSYNPSFVERFGASYDPEPPKPLRSGSVLGPSGTLEDRTSDRERTGTYSQRSRKGLTQTRDPGWRATLSEAMNS